jgi:hypothetical protein
MNQRNSYNFLEQGKRAYHEWVKCNGYTVSKEVLLDASNEQLEEFKRGLISERKKFIYESDDEHLEVFWAVLDELGVATEIEIV